MAKNKRKPKRFIKSKKSSKKISKIIKNNMEVLKGCDVNK